MNHELINFPDVSEVIHTRAANLLLVNIIASGKGSYSAQMSEVVTGFTDNHFAEAGLRADLATTFSHPVKRRVRTAKLLATAMSDAPMASYRIFQSVGGDPGPAQIIGVSNIARDGKSVSATTRTERLKALTGNHHRDLGRRALSGYINTHLAGTSSVSTTEAAFDETITLAYKAGVRELHVSKMEVPRISGLLVIEHEVDLESAGFRVTGETEPLVIDGDSYPGENWVLELRK